MLKTIKAETFFGNNIPPYIPSDTDIPNIDILIDRTNTLNPSSYPLKILKDILQCENKRIGAGQSAVEFIHAIDNNTVFVICGQQSGLFGGPLYTLYKAMHAVRLSSILSNHTGRKVIPVFWVAADDHDFQEINHLGVRTNDGNKFIIEYTPLEYNAGFPAGEIILDEGIFDAIDSLTKHCPPGNKSEQYIDIIRTAWQPGISWSDAFASQMSKIFSQYGLVLFNPRWDGIKELFKDIMIAELTDPLATSTLINEEAEKFETSKKRRKALRKPDKSTNLFFENEGIRYPLLFDKNRFRAGELTLSKEELIDFINSTPDRFSPGAALRPICQDAVLPAVATISGPGERIYLEQINPVYRLFNVSRSIPWPRASFTIIDRRTLRISEKEQITLEKLFLDMDHIRLELARNTFPADIKNKLDTIESTIDKSFESLAKNISSLDPTLVKSIIKDKGRVLHTIAGIRNRAVRAHKAALHITENRFASVSYFLMPDNNPQERWFGIDAVISTLDGSGFDELLELTSPEEKYHRIVLPEETQ